MVFAIIHITVLGEVKHLKKKKFAVIKAFSLVICIVALIFVIVGAWQSNSSSSIDFSLEDVYTSVSVSFGGKHGPAITANSDLYIWGLNRSGQLGYKNSSYNRHGFQYAVMFPVHVTAQQLRIPEAAPRVVDVEDATVRLYRGRGRDAVFVRSARTNSSGIAHIFIGNLSEEDLREATVVAYKEIYSGSGIYDVSEHDRRNPLFNHFGTDDDGNPIRFMLQLRSEEIDNEGNWVGEPILPYLGRQMELRLQAPRLLVNLAVSYLDHESVEDRADYKTRLRVAMSQVSELLAKATDGHVHINHVILVPASCRLEMFNLRVGRRIEEGLEPHLASMADIRIETRADERVQFTPNAMPNGFFSAREMPLHVHNGLDAFENLTARERYDLSDRVTFPRVKMHERWRVRGDIFPSRVGSRKFSNIVVHELGHYLFGFLDENLDGNGDSWGWLNLRPIIRSRYFGLMDNEHAAIRLSRQGFHYSYDGAFGNDPRRNTLHSWAFGESTEKSLARLLTTLTTLRPNAQNWNYVIRAYESPGFQFAHTDYVINFSLDPIANYVFDPFYEIYMRHRPRTASYPFATLSYDDFTIIPRDEAEDDDLTSVSITELFENTFVSLADVQFSQNGNVIGMEIEPYHDTEYSLYIKRASNSTPIAVPLDYNDGLYTTNLVVTSGEIIILYLRAEVDGNRLQNEFFIDHMQSDVGYAYKSIDSRVAGYAMSDSPITTLYIADNTTFENGEFFSVGQATHLITTSSGKVRGEIYAETDVMANIDKTSISWFVRKDGTWIQLPTDLSDIPQNVSIGARADYVGDGLYVLMARAASEDAFEQIQNVSY